MIWALKNLATKRFVSYRRGKRYFCASILKAEKFTSRENAEIARIQVKERTGVSVEIVAVVGELEAVG